MKTKRLYPLLLSLLMTTTSWAQSENEETALLTGTMRSQRLTSAILRSGANGLGFYATSNASVAANTAYVDRTKTILINLESLDAATEGIEQPERTALPARKTIYALGGRRQVTEHKGLNIIRKEYGNGNTETKKVVR